MRALAVCVACLAAVSLLGAAEPGRLREQVGLNFIRPDAGRPGNHDFVNNGEWLVTQYKAMGLKWNRLAFSWVLVQPRNGEFDWSAYDRVVNACRRQGIEILATLGGHFDNPPVPAWAGTSLAAVVKDHPEYLEAFVRAWVTRYKDRIHYWEILNEPSTHHIGLTVRSYVDGILKPSYRIIKAVDPAAQVLPCPFNQLPVLGDPEEFWEAARGFYDIHNLHHYQDWGYFRQEPSAAREEQAIRSFRRKMEEHGEASKKFWVTEIGWWGTASIGAMTRFYRKDPATQHEFRVSYPGREILTNPVVLREDQLRARWLADLFPRILAIPGCDKAFLWTSVDEFDGGYEPDQLYGREGPPARLADLWGVIAGDRTWRTSAYALRDLLRSR